MLCGEIITYIVCGFEKIESFVARNGERIYI